jgi:predicted PhzF superfamily epimerase YddE/YHI9
MTRLPYFQVNAFVGEGLLGNPAAVIPLEHWLNDALMQRLAFENDLAETAFCVRLAPGRWHLRWFTPLHEVRLCGHATLASSWVLFNRFELEAPSVSFETLSGELTVERDGDRLRMRFPRHRLEACAMPPGLPGAMGVAPIEIFEADDNYYLVYQDELELRSLKPDMAGLLPLHPNGVVATAPGRVADIVSRYFAPSYGIPEDPVTGSTHSGLTPYWAERLKKSELYARQLSARGGELFCRLASDHVSIAGLARLYLEGEVHV